MVVPAPPPVTPTWREVFERYLREVKYGSVTVTVQSGQAVRVEKRETTTFTKGEAHE